ncbi:hypothetical protein MIND_00720700 [Mycena indigotica]|uniref:Uncharacterized protein n=1 Tax=Mycena indigotica TaxID=2126181 RepID=A0A8H6SMI4_9AGAR|nr:uncharacterized protein MIND_00720700 [Mycena indigotica]KAF7301552.1 hypothetical protein MIND_00720700 [Mycena indigotica]
MFSEHSSSNQLASQTLAEESNYRFPSFSAADAVTLGLSMRKRFRGSARHAKGKGLIISIQTIAGHPLFACTVDSDNVSGLTDLSLDGWSALEGMINIVKRTSHSSYYVENSLASMGKSPKQMELQGDFRITGGAFPIWLENAPCCPIAIAACYSGSSYEDHRLVSTTVRDYLRKMHDNLDENAPSGPESTVDATLPAGTIS